MRGKKKKKEKDYQPPLPGWGPGRELEKDTAFNGCSFMLLANQTCFGALLMHLQILIGQGTS